jgi:uncharacterized protein YuzE
MSTYSLQVTFRQGQPFAAYLYLPHSPGTKSVRTVKVSEDVLIDYAADGTPLGIEIVSPTDVRMDDIYTAFDRLGLTRPEPAELSPLRAA